MRSRTIIAALVAVLVMASGALAGDRVVTKSGTLTFDTVGSVRYTDVIGASGLKVIECFFWAISDDTVTAGDTLVVQFEENYGQDETWTGLSVAKKAYNEPDSADIDTPEFFWALRGVSDATDTIGIAHLHGDRVRVSFNYGLQADADSSSQPVGAPSNANSDFKIKWKIEGRAY